MAITLNHSDRDFEARFSEFLTTKREVSPDVDAAVREIAKRKFNDLNARDEDHAVRIIEGTARSMGIEVV